MNTSGELDALAELSHKTEVNDMKQRIVTGLIAAAVFVTATILGGYVFSTLIVLMSVVGLYEYSRMNKLKFSSPLHLISLFGLLALVIPFEQYQIAFVDETVVTWLLLFALLSWTVFSKNSYTLDQAGLAFIGTIYVGYGFSAMIDTRMIEDTGLIWCLLAFCSIWASDIGAYFVGRAFGRRKLCPLISPNKTIEGAIGGVLSSIVIAAVLSFIFVDVFEIWRALLIGLVAAVAGQLGDLIQSAYKRVRGLKILVSCFQVMVVFWIAVTAGLLYSLS